MSGVCLAVASPQIKSVYNTWCHNTDSRDSNMSWKGMILWSWLWVAKHATEEGL